MIDNKWAIIWKLPLKRGTLTETLSSKSLWVHILPLRNRTFGLNVINTAEHEQHWVCAFGRNVSDV